MIRKLLDKITMLLTWLCGILMVLTILLVVANVLTRTIFTAPIKGTVELVQYSIMAIAVLIMARTCFEDKHIYVTVFTEKVPEKIRAYIYAFGRFVSAVLFGVMAFLLFKSLAGVSERVSDILHLPVSIMYTIMGLGVALTAIAFAAQGCFFIADSYNNSKGGAEK